MKYFHKLVFCISILLPVSLIASENTAIQLFKQANEMYAKGNYAEAALLYDSLVKEGYQAPELFYNLGNSYFKTQNVGPCILNYERALKLRPGDKDIEHNLSLAKKMIITKIQELPELGFITSWKNFVGSKSSAEWSWLSIALIWIALLIGSLFIFIHSVKVKRISFYTASTLIVISMFFIFLSWRSYTTVHSGEHGIIMVTNTYVKSAPDKQSTDLFILHEGVKANIMDEVDGWRKIMISDGNVGWVPSDVIQII